MAELLWLTEQDKVDWEALSNLYKIAPLSNKPAKNLETVFSNSMFKCFVYAGDMLVGVGRALADGLDCSYICDIAVHPDYQGIQLGKAIVDYLVTQSKGHKKIILYANPGKEGFYQKLGFYPMQTAMAIFADHQQALASGIIAANP
ncbi:GNAT family N-acetyltransferase [Undibacterium sp. TJN19]|uniref:GNAT family N-acetyltransferase n=1 Tax=Undibacterium sp. TJN19 TaxID=3413055 RepID=UPI003BEFEE9B